jgi:hypothetical protein
MSSHDPEQNLAALAVEFWRLVKVHERTVAELPIDRQPRGLAQNRYAVGRLASILQENGIRMIVYDGQEYEPNLPVSVVNADEVAGAEKLFVDRTIEPTFVADGKVLSMGKVALKAGDN